MRMKLLIYLPCYGPSAKFDMCRQSIIANSMGKNWFVERQTGIFKTLRQAKVEDMLLNDCFNEWQDATHIMMVDALDSIFVRGVDKIIQAYKAMGSPDFLCSAERHCYPKQELAPMIEALHPTVYPYRYPNTGGWIGKVEVVRQLWRRGLDLYGGEENDQGIFQGLLVDGSAWNIVLDHECRIWQTSPDMDVNVGWERSGKSGELRCKNRLTRTYPCVLHFNGGYADPVEGKKERMQWAWQHTNR